MSIVSISTHATPGMMTQIPSHQATNKGAKAAAFLVQVQQAEMFFYHLNANLFYFFKSSNESIVLINFSSEFSV